MALAGPAANFALMLAAAAAIRAGIALGHFRPPASASLDRITESAHAVGPTFGATLLSILFALNLLLGAFNLLPIPPLDGNTGVTLLMSERRALKFLDWTQNSGLGFLGLLLAWALFGRIFHVLFGIALNLLYPGARYG
jgi:Zn-dependent protease